MTEHYDNLEIRSQQEREQELVQSLGSQLVNAKTNTIAYRQRLKDFRCDAFSSLGDLKNYPLTRKSELLQLQQQYPPFGGFTAFKHHQLKYIFSSPGPVYEASTQRSDYFRFARALYAAGFRAGNLAHNCFSYHLTPAGFMADGGCHALGCGVIPAGVGQTDSQVQTIADLKPDGYIGTPSFLKIILEKADELKIDVRSMTRALVSGEALPPALRKDFAARGLCVLQCFATADLGMIAYESSPQSGLIVDEGVHLEIVRPGSGDQVADGEVGEVVVTTLNPDYPLIRFATGDLSAILAGESACGRTNKRIKGWMGRADQTAKVRGMFIHPQQVDNVVKRHVEIIKAKLVIDWVEQSDQMTLHCETTRPSGSLGKAISKSIRELCKVRGEVNFVAPNAMANDGLVIQDVRKYDQ